MPDQPKTFRARYDALEQRRAELLERLEGLGERARHNPATPAPARCSTPRFARPSWSSVPRSCKPPTG